MKNHFELKFKTKLVQDVSVGDVVKCKDFKSNKIDVKVVKHVFTPTIKHYNQYTVILSNGLQITGSNIHPVWCKKISGETSWVEMQYLDIGDALYTDEDVWVEIVDINLCGIADETFYDFTVGDHHNYYAGRNGKFILSHNSSSVHVPIWHYEIEDIVVLKNNGGTEDSRVRNMDYSIQMSKLFYERFMKNEMITLFSPHEVPDLYASFGMPEFDEMYVKYEKSKDIRYKRTIRASALMSLLVKERTETGRIYIMNIDHCNDHGSFVEQVTMSNLCLVGETLIDISTALHGDITIQLKDLEKYMQEGSVHIRSFDTQSSTDTLSLVSAFAQTGESTELIEIEDSVTGKTVVCTPDHQIYTQNRGYVKAAELIETDVLVIDV